MYGYIPLHVSLGVSRHSATCHLWDCTTNMENGIWQMGQKCPEDGPSAVFKSRVSVSWFAEGVEGVTELLCSSLSTWAALTSPLSAALTLTSLPGDLTEEGTFLLDVFLEVHLLLATVPVTDDDSRLFCFFSRGLYSQMSFSEWSFCDICSKKKASSRKPSLLYKTQCLITSRYERLTKLPTTSSFLNTVRREVASKIVYRNC